MTAGRRPDPDLGATSRLSDLLGATVWSPDAEPLGRLVDVVVDVAHDPPRTTRLVWRARRDRYDVDWRSVRRFDDQRIEVASAMATTPASSEGLGPLELFLARDVMDSQIVDLAGRRLVRASDVLLSSTDDGELVVVGIDVGFGSVLRRIGLRRWSARLKTEIVAWNELHLASRRGHEVQLVADNAHLHHLSAEDLAHLLARLTTEHAGGVLTSAPVERAAAALAASHDEVGSRVLASLPRRHADAVLDALPRHRAHALRRLADPRRTRRRARLHRTRGWKRHAPPSRSSDG